MQQVLAGVQLARVQSLPSPHARSARKFKAKMKGSERHRGGWSLYEGDVEMRLGVNCRREAIHSKMWALPLWSWKPCIILMLAWYWSWFSEAEACQIQDAKQKKIIIIIIIQKATNKTSIQRHLSVEAWSPCWGILKLDDWCTTRHFCSRGRTCYPSMFNNLQRWTKNVYIYLFYGNEYLDDDG